MEPTKNEIVYITNQKPSWNATLKSLVLKFHNTRVTVASPRNFVLHLDSDDSRAMQFGNQGKDMYVLDFKAPLSPLQAFGACLSTFSWIDDNDDNES